MSLADLRAAFVQAAPSTASLETFFDQWLDRLGSPVLDVEWSQDGDGEAPAARIEIRQRGEPYDLRLEIAVDSGSGSVLHEVELSKQAQTYVLHAAGPPTDVRIDPNHRLLLWDPDYGPRTRAPKLLSNRAACCGKGRRARGNWQADAILDHP